MGTEMGRLQALSPICILCWHHFGACRYPKGTIGMIRDSEAEFDQILDSDNIFDEPCWNEEQRSKKLIIGTPSDLENIRFERPWMWTRIFRAIYRPHQTTSIADQNWFLSGVGLFGSWNLLTDQIQVRMPVDANEMVLGDIAKAPGKLTEDYRAMGRRFNVLWAGSALLMHERCWALANRVLGRDHVRKLINPLIDAMWYTWRAELKGKTEDANDIRDEEKWLNRGKRKRQRESNYPWPLKRPRGPLKQDPCISMLEISDILERLKTEDKGSVLKIRLVPASCSFPPKPATNPPYLGPGKADIFDLPSEMPMEIMDCLAQHDIRNLFSGAFSQWLKIPQTYWRARFGKDNWISLNTLPDPDGSDWGFLYIYANELLAHSASDGLKNQYRIIHALSKADELLKEYDEENESGRTRSSSKGCFHFDGETAPLIWKANPALFDPKY